jgi:hypothetical protein
MTTPILESAKATHEALTGERFCGNCQRYVALDKGGAWKPTRQAKRWLCGPCVERKRVHAK